MIRAAVAALMGVAIVSACATASASSNQAGRLEGPIRVAVGSDERYSCLAGAARVGAFAAYGLDVRMVVTAAEPTLDTLQGGGADVVASDVSAAVFAAAQRPGLQLVAIYATSNDFVKLYARPGAPLTPAQGTLGVVAGSSGEAAAAHLMSAHPGLKLAATSADAMVAAMGAGTLDYALAAGDGAPLTNAGARIAGLASDFGYDYEQGLVTDGVWLSGHESQVRRLTEALAVSCNKAGQARSTGLDATFTFGIRAPSGADMTSYALELGLHSGRAGEASMTVSNLVRQDLVSDTNTLNPGCDCQWLPSPSPATT
jgi:ABC-type nitrate/sulfonate/bicarbonate transport system substrate-binding protein